MTEAVLGLVILFVVFYLVSRNPPKPHEDPWP